MGWLDELFGGGMGGMGGGSMMDMAKQADPQMSFLQAIGLAPQNQYDAPIGAMPGTGTPMPSSVIDPKLQSQQRSSMLGQLGNRLSQWGAGVSQASGPSRMPVDFGQALAGGTNALQAGQDRDMDNRLKEAQIVAYGAKQRPDFSAQAQDALVKLKMGLPLTPQEQATLQAWDAFETSKLQTVTMPDQSIRQVPAHRPVFGQLTGNAPAGGTQAPRPDPMQRLQQLRQMRPQGM
jgi:hypothetical protein